MSLFGPSIPPYDRQDWPHWKDDDEDGQDARQEALIRDSLVPVTFKSERERRVASGHWVCPYTGTQSTNPSKMQIDHVIALKEAHEMGGHAWTRDEKQAFANDPDNLLTTSGASNQAKSANNVYYGMPPNIAYWGAYLMHRGMIVAKYDLTQSAREKRTIAFFQKRWERHSKWVKIDAVRAWLPSWMPGSF